MSPLCDAPGCWRRATVRVEIPYVPISGLRGRTDLEWLKEWRRAVLGGRFAYLCPRHG